MKITRRQILDAIRLEPLAPGSWCRPLISGGGPRAVMTQKNCLVCAVGAVMRRALDTPTQRGIENWSMDACRLGDITPGGYLNEEREVEEACLDRDAGYPMSALSRMFEFYAEKYTMPTVRKKLSTFVKQHFPKEIEVNI